MKAVRFLGNEQMRVEEVPMPSQGGGRILVKILASAVCGSERKSWVNEIPADEVVISGHEAVGEVADANGSKRFKVGDRVCIQIMDGCGRCYYCLKGLPTFCQDLKYEGRCHAQYVAMPEACLVPIAADIDPKIAVLLGGDLLGVAYRATSQLPITPGKLVYVSGGGPIGLGIIFMLKALGAYVVLSEPHAFRREYAKVHCGADEVMDPFQENVQERLWTLTEGVGPEITIECSGQAIAQEQALSWTRCQGHVMFCGENYKGLTIVPSNHIIHKELNVHGAFYFAPSDVPRIVSLYRQGFDPSALISHHVSIDEAPNAFAEFFAGRTGKVILNPWA